ncbi:MAG TPA: hypothetical protein VGB24_09625 [Longimicrobium sp.]|jgi:hypothetical protein|uniref:hypothetical protein n=1 Tax=Longimicrobium sp. TaxID=2029185 RepID=UPI002ED8C9C9
MNRAARATLLVAAMLLLAGCTYWKPPTPAPRYALSEKQSRVLITRRDSTRVQMSRAVLFRDSISGTVNGRRTAVAVSDIAYVQYRRPERVQTQGVTGMFVVAGLFLVTLAGLAFLFPDD